mmetsp:Transcript_15987/g.37886  ORF Transcript_15987/g.37886 Transcript_15987/m.37886 type:complete len:311 (+) Transcript_15987:59-991(+)
MAGRAFAPFLDSEWASTDFPDSEDDPDADDLSDTSEPGEMMSSPPRTELDETWQLEVRKLSGETFKPSLHCQTTVTELRKDIEVQFGIPPECQRWIVAEKACHSQGARTLAQSGLSELCALTVVHVGHQPLQLLPSRFDVKLVACNMNAAYRDSSRVSLFRIRGDVHNREMTIQRSTRNHWETYTYDLEKKCAKYSGGHCLCVPSQSETPFKGDPLLDFVSSWQITSEMDFKHFWHQQGKEGTANFWRDPFTAPLEDCMEVKVDIRLGTLGATIVRMLIDTEGRPMRVAVKHAGRFLHEYKVQVREWPHD